MNIGANIKKFRKEKGLTQQELADLIGKHSRSIQKYESGDVNVSLNSSCKNTIYNYENGKREPKTGTLQAIADALGVTVQELITGEKQQVETIEKDISQFSTDELLKEIISRGFEITLK
ncbi:helix-turn-helix domain-containing protein [Paraclostridium tenue]